jgi:hypothetical protein
VHRPPRGGDPEPPRAPLRGVAPEGRLRDVNAAQRKSNEDLSSLGGY